MIYLAFFIQHWRYAAIVGLLVALAVQTARLEFAQDEFEDYRSEAAARAEHSRGRAEAANAHLEMVNEELEHDIAEERAARAREKAAARHRYGDLHRQYLGVLNKPDSGRVPAAAASPSAALRDCIPAERLDAALRRDLGALHAELRALIGEGAEAVADGGHWGDWARLVGVCEKK